MAWWLLLACVAVLPLVTSIGVGTGDSLWAGTTAPYHAPKLLVLTVLLGAASVTWLVDVLARGLAVRVGPTLAAFGAFALLIAVSTALAPQPLSSLFGASGLATGTVTWLLCIWLAVLVGQYLTSGDRFVSVSWALVTGATGVALISLLQSAELDPLKVPLNDTTVWMVRQGASTIGNPDYTGLLLVAPAIMALTLAFVERVEWRRWTALACTAVIGGAVFVTLTRAAWLGVMIGIVLLVALAPGERAAKRARALWIAGGTAAAALVAYLLVGVGPVRDRFKLLEGGFEKFTSGRSTLWADALRIIGNHPLAGTGADRLALGGYEVQRSVILEGSGRFVLQDPHNAFLLAGGVFGVPALLALLAAIGLVLASGWRQTRASGGASRGRMLHLGWFAGLAGVLVTALFSVWTITGVFVLFLALGVVASPALKPTSAPRRAPVALTLSVLALVLAGLSLFGTTRTIAAEHHAALAQVADSQYHLEEAMRLVPWDARTHTDYYWKKINAMAPILQGEDVNAAHDMAASLDAEITVTSGRFPRELLFYRLRIDLYAMSQGYPGYQTDKHLEAIDEALAAFPGDPEFTERRETLSGGASQ